MIRSSSASYALIRVSSRFNWFVGLAVENRRMGESDMASVPCVVLSAVVVRDGSQRRTNLLSFPVVLFLFEWNRTARKPYRIQSR